ncbi:MAG: T9SS type A sorting domain-containing protein [Saprospiraceae bacterium]
MQKHLLIFIFLLFAAVGLSAQAGLKPDLSVFPNPTTEYISVNDLRDQVGHVVVYNLVGKKVKEVEYNRNDQVYVADLPKGMYLVQVQDRSRKVLATQKVDKR